MTGDPVGSRSTDAPATLRSGGLAMFESDAWLARVVRAEEPTLVGEVAGYRLVRLVARGAQGTVYEGVEPRTGRRVALKRLLRTAGTSASEETRFARETSVLAALVHPNIVGLLAAPESDGARVLVMEWVEGAPLDHWADGVRAGQPGAQAIRTIVQVLADVARAVAAAHALCIVHRDLKPTNVLVTTASTAKVLDFGLAKSLEASEVTQTNGFAGTPSWAAPEQIDGGPDAVDARTDVHALGLLAYRALVGRPAFDPTLPIGSLFESIRNHVPVIPSSGTPRIPRELALVVQRALEKEPARRYETASAFADDLARFLADEPVQAHPPSALYQARSLVRRHRAASIAFATAIGAVLVGSVLAIASAVDANRARIAEAARADEADLARRRAERMSGFFTDLLANLRERETAGERSSASEIIAMAAQSLDTRQNSSDTDLDLRLALGRALSEIADYKAAMEQYARALLLAEQAGDLLTIAEIEVLRAKCGRLASVADDAIAPADRAIELVGQLGDTGSQRAVRIVIDAEGSRAFGLLLQGRLSQAGQATDRALALARSIDDAERVASALSTKALVMERGGKLAEAAEIAREAADFARGNEAIPEPARARINHNAAYLLTASRPAEAIVYADESVATRLAIYGPRHPSTVLAQCQRALALRGLGRHDEAIALLIEMIGVVGEIRPESAARLSNIHRHLAATYSKRNQEGDEGRAIEAYERAIQISAFGEQISTRLRSSMSSLCKAIARRDGREAAIARVLAIPGELAAASGDPLQGALARTQALRCLNDRVVAPAPPIDDAMVALLRQDVAGLSARFGADSLEACESKYALILALEMRGSPESRAEASRRRTELAQEVLAVQGPRAPLARDLGVGEGAGPSASRQAD